MIRVRRDLLVILVSRDFRVILEFLGSAVLKELEAILGHREPRD